MSKNATSNKLFEPNRAHLDHIEALAGIGSWEWNAHTNEVSWSVEQCRIFGCSPDPDQPGLAQSLNLIHPADRDRIAKLIDVMKAEGTPFSAEYRIIRPDGVERVLHARNEVTVDAEGNVENILGTNQDITEVRYERERKFEFFDRGRDGMFILELDRPMPTSLPMAAQIAYLSEQAAFSDGNQAFVDLYHTSKQELLGKTFSKLGINIGKTARDFIANNYQLHNHLVAEAFPNSPQRWLSASITGVVINDTLYRLWGSVREISELVETKVNLENRVAKRTRALQDEVAVRQNAEQRAVEAKLEAERANRAKSDFLAKMSHELRTPLNAIVGFTQLLGLDTTSLGEQKTEWLQHIDDASSHLLRLVEDLLDTSSIDSGKLAFKLETTNVHAVLMESGSMVMDRAKQHQIELQIDGDSCVDLTVHADPDRLKQALVNLLTNAIKYNRSGGRVELACATLPEQYIRISITDNGLGIPVDRQGELFTHFSRAGAELSNTEGTGLGLVVCKTIVEAMGGQLGYISEVGRGSTFWIDLPSC